MPKKKHVCTFKKHTTITVKKRKFDVFKCKCGKEMVIPRGC